MDCAIVEIRLLMAVPIPLDGFSLIGPCPFVYVKFLEFFVVRKAFLEDRRAESGVIVKGVPGMPDALGIKRICFPAGK